MKAIDQIKVGLGSYPKAFQLIFKKGFIKFLIFPLLLNVILIWLGWEISTVWATNGQEAFSAWVSMEGAEYWGSGAINWLVDNIVGFMIKVLFFIIYAYTSGFVILILLAPVFSILSEKTEHALFVKDEEYPFDFKQMMKDTGRGIILAVKNLTIETAFMLLMFVIGFIPVVGWIAPIIMFFISAYFFGFSFMDYTNERRKRTPNESSIYLKKYRWTAISVGSLYALSVFIPFCGPLLSPFFATVSVIAGTISMLEIERRDPHTANAHLISKDL